MKVKVLIIIIFIFSYNLYSDIIFLNNGNEYKGKFIKIEKKYVILNRNNKNIKYKKSEIKSIVFQKQREYDGIKNINDIKSNEIYFKKYMNLKLNYVKDAGYINLYNKVVYTHIKKNIWKIEKYIFEKILQKRGEKEGLINIYYLNKYDKLKINYAFTINKKGEIFHLDDNALRDESIFSSPIYENLRRKRFSLPKSKIGNYLCYKTTIIRKYNSDEFPFFIDYNFFDKEPVYKNILELNVKKLDDIVCSTFNDTNIKRKVIKTKNKIKYVFSLDDFKGYNTEPNMPDLNSLFPYINISFKKKLKRIAKIYRKKIFKKINFSNDLDFIVKDLKKLDREQRIRKIYSFVQKNINTENIPLNYYGYRFHKIRSILNVRSANFADKILLMMALLKKAGIQSDFIFCKSNKKGLLNKRNINIRQFDGVICRVSLKNKFIYLAPFDKQNPFGVIPVQYQNTTGLLINKNTEKIIKIPYFTIKKNGIIKNINLKVNADNSINVSETITFNSNNSISFRYITLMPIKKQTEFFENMISSINNSAILIDYKLYENDLDNSSYVINFSYKISDYILSAGDKAKTFQLPGENLGFEFNKLKRIYDIRWFGLNYEKINYNIVLDKKFKFDYFPENINLKCNSIFYELKFDKVKENNLSINSFYNRDIEFLNKNKYLELRELSKQKSRLFDYWFIIVRD